MSESEESKNKKLQTVRGDQLKDKLTRAQSSDNVESGCNSSHALKKDVDSIRLSLDVLKEKLITQQYVLARDFQARIRHVYDDVINDLNEIRKQVNDIGDTCESETKFKSWTPVMPFRKGVLQSVYDVRQKGKLKGSKSVDFVDRRGEESERNEADFDKFQSKTLFCKRQSWFGASQSSINSSSSPQKVVPGFGCCFGGDGKTVPYRSYKAWHQVQRRHRHSWGPSRSGSRSTLDDDDFEDRGCLCGEVTGDWRSRVAPYMWEGWPVPGIDKLDMEKLRERMEHMEAMRHEIVHVHNEYRRQHGCPELTVTTDLAKDAQQWSDIIAMGGYAQYSDSQNRGENILVVNIADSLSGRQVVDTWYRESRFYNYKQSRWQRGTSNFTQMIWHSSHFIGVGISKFPYDNTYVIVVQYQPPGNINTPGQFRRNVPVPIVVKSLENTESLAAETDCVKTKFDKDSYPDTVEDFENSTHKRDSTDDARKCKVVKDTDINNSVDKDSNPDLVDDFDNSTHKRDSTDDARKCKVVKDTDMYSSIDKGMNDEACEEPEANFVTMETPKVKNKSEKSDDLTDLCRDLERSDFGKLSDIDDEVFMDDENDSVIKSVSASLASSNADVPTKSRNDSQTVLVKQITNDFDDDDYDITDDKNNSIIESVSASLASSHGMLLNEDENRVSVGEYRKVDDDDFDDDNALDEENVSVINSVSASLEGSSGDVLMFGEECQNLNSSYEVTAKY